MTELINEIRAFIIRIDKKVIKGQEAEDFFADSIRKAKEIFGQNSDEWRLLDRWEHEKGYQWHAVYKPGIYAGEKEKQKLQDLMLKLEEISGDENHINIEPNEYTFSAGQRYEAYRLILSLIKRAEKTVVIVDNYLDEIIFDFLDVIPTAVSVQIITGEQKPIFKKLFLALKEKDGPNVDAKINKASHDRYLVIDDLDVYSFGASINTIGKGDFMVHRLNEQTEVVLKKIGQWWTEGQSIS